MIARSLAEVVRAHSLAQLAPTRHVLLLAEADIHTTRGPILYRSPPVPPGALWAVVHASAAIWSAGGEDMGFPGPRLLPFEVPAHVGALPPHRPRFGAWRRPDNTAVPLNEEPPEAPEGWIFELPIELDSDPAFAWRASVAILVTVGDRLRDARGS